MVEGSNHAVVEGSRGLIGRVGSRQHAGQHGHGHVTLLQRTAERCRVSLTHLHALVPLLLADVENLPVELGWGCPEMSRCLELGVDVILHGIVVGGGGKRSVV